MCLESKLLLNLYSIALLLVVIHYTVKHHDRRKLQNALFLGISWVTILLLMMDVLARTDGMVTGPYPFFNQIGNYFLYLLGPALGMLWFLYLHVQVYQQKEATLRLLKPLGLLLAANALFCTVSLHTGWLYTIDSGNVYHRGPWLFIPVLLDFGLLLFSTAYLIAFRRKLGLYHFSNLLVLPVMVGASMVVQLIFYALPIIMNAFSLGVLIIFINIQNQNVYTDHLTGIYNRKRLDKYLVERDHQQSGIRPFGGMLLDVDRFKEINDTYGHAQGDLVLREIAKLIQGCLRSDDFVARYGGDEFFVVVNTGSRRVLEDVVRRLRRALKKLNDSGALGHPVSLSMGYDIYDPQGGFSVEEFQKQLDERMYDIKKQRRANA